MHGLIYFHPQKEWVDMFHDIVRKPKQMDRFKARISWTGKQHRQCPGKKYCSIYLGIPLQLKDFLRRVQAKSPASQKIIRNSRHASIMGAIWPGVRWQHDTSGPLSGVSAI